MLKIILQDGTTKYVQNMVNMSRFSLENRKFQSLLIYFYPETSLSEVLTFTSNSALLQPFTVRGSMETETPEQIAQNTYIREDGEVVAVPEQVIEGYTMFGDLEYNTSEYAFKDTQKWSYCLTLYKPCAEDICQDRLDTLLDSGEISLETYNYLKESFYIEQDKQF